MHLVDLLMKCIISNIRLDLHKYLINGVIYYPTPSAISNNRTPNTYHPLSGFHSYICLHVLQIYVFVVDLSVCCKVVFIKALFVKC